MYISGRDVAEAIEEVSLERDGYLRERAQAYFKASKPEGYAHSVAIFWCLRVLYRCHVTVESDSPVSLQ